MSFLEKCPHSTQILLASEDESTLRDAQSEESYSYDDDRVLVDGLWDHLGLKALPDAEAAGGSGIGDSGGSTDHELYDALLTSYQEVEVAPMLRESGQLARNFVRWLDFGTKTLELCAQIPYWLTRQGGCAQKIPSALTMCIQLE